VYVDPPFPELKPKPKPRCKAPPFSAIDCSDGKNQRLRDELRRQHLHMYHAGRGLLQFSLQEERIGDDKQEIPDRVRDERTIAERARLDGRDGGSGSDLEGCCVNGEAGRRVLRPWC
jgi:hypothetical protein